MNLLNGGRRGACLLPGLAPDTEYNIPIAVDTGPPGGEMHTERVQVRALGSGIPAG